MMLLKRKVIVAVVLVLAAVSLSALQLLHSQPHLFEPLDIWTLRRSYPDILFRSEYDDEKEDWKVELTVSTSGTPQKTVLYWAGGRLLPESELANKDRYWPILYKYTFKIPDPAAFSEKDVERIRDFTSRDTRRNGAVTPTFFYDAVYDSSSRLHVEQHIVRIPFLGKWVSVHERITEPLKRVEQRINNLAADSTEVRVFLDRLSRVDGYLWREIRDRYTKSFHSYGIAVDILPRGWGSRILYWGWQKDKDPENWMLTPLKDRWMPPQSVIEAFESEGFIWGGKWTVWDNMHFEYHPELILYRERF